MGDGLGPHGLDLLEGSGRRRRINAARGRHYSVLDDVSAWPATEKEARRAHGQGKSVRYRGGRTDASDQARYAAHLSDMIARGDRGGARRKHSTTGFDAALGFSADESKRRERAGLW